jgi:microcystin-dependent protein
MDSYVGEVKMFAGLFAPMDWLFCDGQLLPVNEYSTLFSLIGTTYGGDGVNYFALPNLCGRVPIGSGAGPGRTPRTPGQSGGNENVTLTVANLPAHAHTVKCDTTTSGESLKKAPQNSLPATLYAPPGAGGCYGTDETNNPIMKTDMILPTGGDHSHVNMPPFGCMYYIICYQGIWPPQS